MIPTYFPMTFLPPSIIRGLAGCFEKTAVYQPSALHIPPSVQTGAEAGTLVVRIPVTGEAEQLEAVLRDYRRWADTHAGAEKAFLKAGGVDVPFYDEFSVHRIRTDLRKTLAGEPEAEGPDPTFSARVFLCMAQEFDRHDWEVESNLSSFRTMEKDLMYHLRGDAADEDFPGRVPGSSPRLLRDPGTRRTGDRLRAWARLVLADPEPPAVWVTTSPAVIEEMRDRFPEITEADRIESIPVPSGEGAISPEFQNILQKYLNGLISASEGPGPPPVSTASSADETVSLRMYRAGISPRRMLSRLIRPNGVAPSDSGQETVLIGLVEMA
jgi:hypothetical protein